MDRAAENNCEPTGGARPSGSERPGVSLLFARGARPTEPVLEGLFESLELSGSAARVSRRAGDGEAWLEVLAGGLAFDLRGIAPGTPAADRHAFHHYGFADGLPDEPLEAIELVPGPHVAAGGGLMPVVQALAGLAANLALNLPVAAVAWHSAEIWLEPRYFSRTVLNWLAGGAFPAPGLVALVPASDDGISSKGLAHFTGQEIQLAAAAGEAEADTMKLAARAVDHLVRRDKLTRAEEISGTGVPLLAEPSQFSNLVWIWRKR
ncbi:MAG TPA: hypothetical protein VJQ77_07435 [Novosphingobium sp.]|nr:hypothetical protein [Novosphingobium sp.]